MKKVISKGYTLEIVSWENDGDHYNTVSITVSSKECARAIHKLCTELFKSGSDRENPGVGNSTRCFEPNEEDPILQSWIEKNMESLLVILKEYCEETDPKNLSYDEASDLISELAHDLMGSSEFYSFRVCKSCEIFYSEVDVFAEEITFDQPK